ncbi:alpha-glycosidase [Cohnella cellulosilytica]|uniref:Alpha-glycosidase n=1 Tax=Cohnella cellulosilytica TaxID=986710 RepID=A0ABW2F8D0_9BACL
MLREAIYHRPKQNWAYAYDNKTVHLRVRTKRGEADEACVIAGDKYAWKQTRDVVPMKLLASDELFDYWEAEVVPPLRRLKYGFCFRSGDERLYMSEKGFSPVEPDNYLTLFEFPFLNPADVFVPPAWVKDAVFYQIFPERFANGDPSLNPEGTLPWGGAPTPTNFFGGDLQGVLERLDHLSALGVNAIYFNPLFEATTNHKYDTKDYLKVDPRFGTNEKLKELVDACHARGIRVMLDAVFNHSGKEFPPFVDVLEKGAESPYAGWFHVRDFPLRVENRVPTYDTFGFEPIMPKLNTENAEVKRYLLDVARYWIEEVGIDGWRLDVANEVDHAFWRELRAVVKGLNPEAYILGEIWHDSISWLQGDQFDAVMNYPVTEAALDFFARGKTGPAQFADVIGSQLAAYPRQAAEAAFNLLGSHDTPRLLTVCGGDERRVKLATLFQLTYPGAACIYYGDEVGMAGGGDPDCRGCMVWETDKQNRELFAFFAAAIRLRQDHEALRSAGFRFLAADGGLLAYERLATDGSERFVVAMNVSERPIDAVLPVDPEDRRTPDPTAAWSPIFGDAPAEADGGLLKAKLPPFGYCVWRRQTIFTTPATLL